MASVPEDPTLHEVQPGQSLSIIGAIHGTDWQEIAAVNGIAAPDYVIVPGWVLVIPPEKDKPPAAPAEEPGAAEQRPARDDVKMQMLKDYFAGPQRFETVPAEEVCEQCKSRQEDPPCCVFGLTVRCGHSKRSFKLQPPATRLIQVIGGSDDTEDMEITLDGGPCKKSKPTGSGSGQFIESPGDGVEKFPSVRLGDVDGLSPYKVKLDAPPPPAGSVVLHDLLGLFMESDSSQVYRYPGRVHACEGCSEFDFDVEVFPKRKWKGEVSIGYDHATDTEVVSYSNAATKAADEPLLVKHAKLYSLKDEGTIGFNGGFDFTYGSRTSKVTLPSFERKTSGARETRGFKALQTFLTKTMPRLNSMLNNELVDVSFKFPKVAFGGEIEYTEHPSDYMVGRSGKVWLKASPFFEINCATDILDWLILAAGSILGSPPAGRALLKIKSKAEKGVGGGSFGVKVVAQILFSAGGRIEGSLEYAYKFDGKDTYKGEIAGKIPLKVNGEVSAEIRVLFVGVTGGVKLAAVSGVEGGLGAKIVGGDPGFSGYVQFNGLKVTVVTFFSVGGSRTGRKKSNSRNGRWGFDSANAKDQEETEHLNLVLLAPGRWPELESSQPVSLAEGA